jgi:hypothetical protein
MFLPFVGKPHTYYTFFITMKPTYLNYVKLIKLVEYGVPLGM